MKRSHTLRTAFAAILISAAFQVLAAGTAGAAVAGEKIPDVTLGIVYYTSPSPNEEIIPDTIRALEKRIGKRHLRVKEYTLEQLRDAIKSGDVDVFLASSGFYRRMVQYGASSLATVASKNYPDPNHSDGAALIVRNDSGIRTLYDAKGSVLGASSPTAFTGYQLALGEVLRQGFDPESFFKKTNFYGGGSGAVSILDALRRKDVDIITLRICWLEGWLKKHPEDKGLFRVIDQRDENEPCQRSTDLYPTWTIGTSANTPPEISKIVTSAVLEMPPTKDGFYWSIATDFRSVDALFKGLKIGPYRYLREWSLSRFIMTYWSAILIGILLVLGLILHSVRTEVLVKRRTAQLQESLRIQKEYEEKSREDAAKISFMEKMGIIGQLCSVFAHEMRQPLGAISLYAQGMKSLIKRGKASESQMEMALGKLETQAERASDIVERVRAYARAKDIDRKPISLNDVVTRSLAGYRSASGSRVRFKRTDANPVTLFADQLEMELVSYNLIKNAAEAVKDQPDGMVEIIIASNPGKALLAVSDNGPALTPEQLAEIENPSGTLKSSKHEGIGLGLLIVKAIVERNGGRLSIENGSVRGVTIYVHLPTADGGDKTPADESAQGNEKDPAGPAEDFVKAETAADSKKETGSQGTGDLN